MGVIEEEDPGAGSLSTSPDNLLPHAIRLGVVVPGAARVVANSPQHKYQRVRQPWLPLNSPGPPVIKDERATVPVREPTHVDIPERPLYKHRHALRPARLVPTPWVPLNISHPRIRAEIPRARNATFAPQPDAPSTEGHQEAGGAPGKV